MKKILLIAFIILGLKGYSQHTWEISGNIGAVPSFEYPNLNRGIGIDYINLNINDSPYLIGGGFEIGSTINDGLTFYPENIYNFTTVSIRSYVGGEIYNYGVEIGGKLTNLEPDIIGSLRLVPHIEVYKTYEVGGIKFKSYFGLPYVGVSVLL